MNKYKVIGMVIGIIVFSLCIVGITYAFLTWRSENISITVSSKCFNILYTKGTDISGAIIPSNDYTGGLSTTIKMNIDSSCDIKANGKLYLETKSETSNNLFREGLLNYHVVSGNTVVSSGNITEKGEIEIDLGQLTASTSASTSYTLYVWIDYNLIENTDAFSAYLGSIRGEAIQFS